MKKFEKKDFIDIMPSHAGEYGNIKVENDCMKGFSPWKIPCYIRNSGLSKQEISNIKRANRYLTYIQRKLIKMSREGETKKVAILGDILMRRSVAFQVMVINKAERGGTYKYEGLRMLRAVKTALRGIRNKRESLVINRSYILKSNGKFRPIGSPNIQSKILLTALEKILRIIIEPKLGEYQHGFRNGKSAQTAGRQIIGRYREGKYFAYEFDLKSFFNMINVQLICSRLNSIAPGLGNGVKATTFETNPIFKEYKEEKEIEEMKIGKHTAYRKRGFTQGSPCAPLLSIWALEFAGFNEIPGLTMYADDGVIMSETADGLKEYLGVKSKLAGVYIAEDKHHGLVPRLNFLGLTLNTLNGTISDGKKTVCIMKDSKDLDRILSFASYERKDVKYHGVWEVKPRSLQGMRRITTKLHLKITTYIYKVTMETLNSIKPEYLNPNTEGNVIGKGLQKWGEEHISGQPKSASTYGSAKLIEYLKNNSNLKRKNVRISDYVPSESSTSGTDFKIDRGKIFIRYPHNGGTIGHEDERISNLFPSNLYKIAKDDA